MIGLIIKLRTKAVQNKFRWEIQTENEGRRKDRVRGDVNQLPRKPDIENEVTSHEPNSKA